MLQGRCVRDASSCGGSKAAFSLSSETLKLGDGVTCVPSFGGFEGVQSMEPHLGMGWGAAGLLPHLPPPIENPGAPVPGDSTTERAVEVQKRICPRSQLGVQERVYEGSLPLDPPTKRGGGWKTCSQALLATVCDGITTQVLNCTQCTAPSHNASNLWNTMNKEENAWCLSAAFRKGHGAPQHFARTVP